MLSLVDSGLPFGPPNCPLEQAGQSRTSVLGHPRGCSQLSVKEHFLERTEEPSCRTRLAGGVAAQLSLPVHNGAITLAVAKCQSSCDVQQNALSLFVPAQIAVPVPIDRLSEVSPSHVLQH
jgi:hypothetical protein